MVKVGILGVGFMGKMHFNAYSAIRGAKVVALGDIDEKKLSGDWSSIGGNIEGADSQVDLSGIHTHAKAAPDLLRDPDVDVVDICLPTFLHAKFAKAALKAGKHVISEKPMGLSIAQCTEMMDAAKKAKRQLFIAHCIRFWPEYAVLKKMIDTKRYGKVLSANFWRKSLTPGWSWDGWLMDAKRSGGALLDLHIHDTDYVNYVFGKPKSVQSTGVVGAVSKGGVDHIVTQHIYPKGPQVTTEGGWAMAPGFGFVMGFCVVTEKATIEYDCKAGVPLTVHTNGGKTLTPKVPAGDGYSAELKHFVQCIAKGKASDVVTAADARDAVAVCLAEGKSVKSGKAVMVQ